MSAQAIGSTISNILPPSCKMRCVQAEREQQEIVGNCRHGGVKSYQAHQNINWRVVETGPFLNTYVSMTEPKAIPILGITRGCLKLSHALSS